MYLQDLPIDNPSYQRKKDIKPGDYYAVQKANEPALIFKCISANDIEVISNEPNAKANGQYECYLLEGDSVLEKIRLKEKCASDHYQWIHRCGIGNDRVMDLSVLLTKFKKK